MPDRLKPILLVLAVAVLGACHNDPFSIKPEVNVTLPEKPPMDTTEPDDAAADSAKGEDGAES